MQGALQPGEHLRVVRNLLRQRQEQRHRRLRVRGQVAALQRLPGALDGVVDAVWRDLHRRRAPGQRFQDRVVAADGDDALVRLRDTAGLFVARGLRSEEHTSELQSLMRISYAVFCLKKKKQKSSKIIITNT